ncbi:MAG TPA: hypothetical protein VG917_00230 [Patescibacteria group bacterium]|nr:hypothetical protein [Patescibacteria group bacterium]
MDSLRIDIKKYLLLSIFLVSVLIYVWISVTIPSTLTQIIRLEQVFALTSLTLLYITIIISPLSYLLKTKTAKFLIRIRPLLIVSIFYFALIHAALAFFGQLGGFAGLPFLDGTFLIAIILSFTALILLLLINMSNFKPISQRLIFLKSRLWSTLLYLVGILILIHALILGTHFQDLSALIPQIFLILLIVLIILEAVRADKLLEEKFSFPKLGIFTMLSLVIAIVFIILPFVTTSNGPSINVHAQHIKLAQEAQQQANSVSNIPGLTGDRTKRFNVEFDHPDNILPNQDTTLTFKISDAANGDSKLLFDRVYGKLMHLVIVDNKLEYYNHIHPNFDGNKFTITTQFPKEGTYHLYIDFQPVGAIEQQFGLTLPVGNAQTEQPNQQPDTNTTKVFGNYEVTMTHPNPLQASLLSTGQQEITFNIKDAKSKKPVTDLKPYLEAFGHLVMINEKNYDYIHVHPSNLVAPKPNENGGPEVKFLPIGIYGPIKPGIYRVFAQFNPNGKLFTANFTVEIK